MKLSTENNQINKYQELFNEISAAKGKELSQQTINTISDKLDKITYNEAKAIVRDICRMPSLPNNIYGAISQKIEELEYYKQKELYRKETWIADKDCLTANEWYWLMKCIAEICQWHHYGLVKKNPTPHCPIMDIDEWDQAGRLKTWSPIVDHFLNGSAKPYKQSIGGSEALEEYFAAYYSTLITNRQERMENINETTDMKKVFE